MKHYILLQILALSSSPNLNTGLQSQENPADLK